MVQQQVVKELVLVLVLVLCFIICSSVMVASELCTAARHAR